jgi:hypothetical protein
MADNYEVIFTHPTGATATFVRQGGELDALAKGLDSEQFWVFKNVKALLARNDPGDLREAQRMMEGMGFMALVREITVAPDLAAMREEVFAGTAAEAEHGAHAHAPQPSFWPVLVAASAAVTLIGGMFWTETYVITIVGLCALFLTMLAWGLESFVVEL